MFHTDVYRGIQSLSGEYGNSKMFATKDYDNENAIYTPGCPQYDPYYEGRTFEYSSSSLRGDTLPPHQTVGYRYRGCTWCNSIREVFRGTDIEPEASYLEVSSHFLRFVDVNQLKIRLKDGDMVGMRDVQKKEIKKFQKNQTLEEGYLLTDDDSSMFLTQQNGSIKIMIPKEYVKSRAKILHRNIYSPDYRPPDWSLNMIDSKLWEELAKQVEVLTLDKREEMVQKVTREREPVNIAMQNAHNIQELTKTFGYTNSGYSTLFESNPSVLPPNIAIYLKTPVGNEKGNLVHVINSIGFGFDTVDQPDYKYFMPDGELNREKSIELQDRLRDVFIVVFACAIRKRLNKVVLSMIGAGAFSSLLPEDYDYMNMCFFPAVQMALKTIPHGSIKTIGMMGNPPEDVMQGLFLICNSKNIEVEKFEFVPQILSADDTLFMNAWDPHSIIGNGNSMDNSLDGYFGRVTAMAYLSFPPINPNIKYVKPDILTRNMLGSSFDNLGRLSF